MHVKGTLKLRASMIASGPVNPPFVLFTGVLERTVDLCIG